MLIKKLLITSCVGASIFSLSAMHCDEFEKNNSSVALIKNDDGLTFAQQVLIGSVLGAGLYSYVVKESGANFSPVAFIASTGIGAGASGTWALIQKLLDNKVIPQKKVIFSKKQPKMNFYPKLVCDEMNVIKKDNDFLLKNIE